jgi:hypothetical protein
MHVEIDDSRHDRCTWESKNRCATREAKAPDCRDSAPSHCDGRTASDHGSARENPLRPNVKCPRRGSRLDVSRACECDGEQGELGRDEPDPKSTATVYSPNGLNGFGESDVITLFVSR